MSATSVRFPRIALVGRHTGAAAETLVRLARFLAARGHAVVLEEETARTTGAAGHPTAAADEIGANTDLVIVLGGDGTMLSIARRLAPHDVPLIGINQGRLGFLTDIPLARMEPTLEAMLEGRFVEERRSLLAATVCRFDGERQAALALNDVVVNRGSLGTMIECAVEIDDRFAFAMRADGMIVATPTTRRCRRSRWCRWPRTGSRTGRSRSPKRRGCASPSCAAAMPPRTAMGRRAFRCRRARA